MQRIQQGIMLVLFTILLYTRFVNIGWGLPYPMHPDERNMASAITQLSCAHISPLSDCLNPHFFAYGQLPLYTAYLMIMVTHLVKGLALNVNFIEGTIALRIISAVASIINVWVLIKIVEIFAIQKKFRKSDSKLMTPDFHIILVLILLTFSPYFIQFSHFGTTESLLMLLYSLIIYFSLKLLDVYSIKISVLLGLFSGLAIATKISSGIFVIVPVSILFKEIIFRTLHHKNIKIYALGIICFAITAAVIAFICSPYNVLSLQEFKNSISYESTVATGALRVFYTRQFEATIPVLFQFKNIFPYVLGWPMYILSICGFFLLPNTKKINIVRLAFLVYFLPTAFLYAKWARFMAPIFPIMSIFGIVFLFHLFEKISKITKYELQNKSIIFNFSLLIIIGISILPGIAYLSIYQLPDVRFEASNWIYNNIPNGSHILSETANVVDIPLEVPDSALHVTSYKYNSFNFYDVDVDPNLQDQLKSEVARSDYIFVPSRRLFKNVKNPNSILADYYTNLFSGALGFREVAEFTSYPKIRIFDKTILEFPDESAEETWTVFDHPVVRIYKKVN